MTVKINEAAINALVNGPGKALVLRKAEEVAETARANVSAEFHQRTGNLARSIRVTPVGASAIVGTVGAPYGRILELGAAPHTIVPNPPRRLLISEPNNPDPLRDPQRSVQHPGSPPRPWLIPALRLHFPL